MRTVLLFVAAIWFLGAAWLIGDGSAGLIGSPPDQQVIGDPAVLAIHLVGRVLLVGLATFSLAFVDWRAVVEFSGWTRDRDA